ncbi:DsbA family protein [Aristophania vespae]|uniref:DsbA family protein n=1 Tax=Aristophania vespae TaxID=2697033 RepID=UPI0023519455|nr:thioredoxin domain-containing protein [Aristophania vespae]UMM63485.1 hypothetical protein DM15PD_04530 [Aristophania vespae]
MANRATKPVSLIWGTGPLKLDIFIEPTCPFCVRTLGKIKPFLSEVGESNVMIELHLHSQPWHLFSPVIMRSILAAATLPDGKNKAWHVLEIIGQHREEFEFKDHASGPNMEATPNDIVRRVEQYSGLSLQEAFKSQDVTASLKRYAKFARQNGIHVSPTFMVNGLIDNRFSSGEDISEWVERVRAELKNKLS